MSENCLKGAKYIPGGMIHCRKKDPKKLKKKGLTKYRSKKYKESGIVIRLACPRGRRREGLCEIQAILYPIDSTKWKCDKKTKKCVRINKK